MIWTSFDYVSGRENFKKSDDIAVGGVFHCRMYQFPDIPRLSMKWTLRKVQSDEDTLKQIHYPDPQSTGQADSVPIVLKMSKQFYTHESDTLKVGVWDEDL